jgi:CHAP domain/Transglycosylase SLT domain
VDTSHRPTPRPPAALLAATAGILALVILAPALLATGSPSASGLSPQLADAPPALVPLALQAGAATGIDGNVLLAIAKVETAFGRARQAQPDDLVPADIRAAVDAAALQPGGATAQLLDLPDGRRIGDWVNPQPVGAEHAMGFMQFLPSTWRAEAAAAPGGPRDPYRPLDAMTVAGSYLHRIELGAAGGGQHDLRGALAMYGGSTAYADQVLALAAPAVTSTLPVVLPIPAPGWVRRIPTPDWPADLAAHMSPAGVTNQCVAGALATWAMMHLGDPRWNHPPPLFGNAIDLYGVARAQGFQVSSQPAPGEMVVYGSSYGLFGHIATVVAVEPGRYEVVEQNFLDFSPNLEPHWQTFDLRSVAWPDRSVVGFVVAPESG